MTTDKPPIDLAVVANRINSELALSARLNGRGEPGDEDSLEEHVTGERRQDLLDGYRAGRRIALKPSIRDAVDSTKPPDLALALVPGPTLETMLDCAPGILDLSVDLWIADAYARGFLLGLVERSDGPP